MAKSTSNKEAAETVRRSTAADLMKKLAERAQEIATANAKAAKLILFLLLAGIVYSVLNHSGSGGVLTAALVIFPDGMNRSGRSGGLVFQRNGRTRRMVVPALVQNTATSTSRNNFAAPSIQWATLTDVERASWNNAIGFTYVDRFGTVHELKGKALFTRINKNLLTVGQPTIATCPPLGAPLGLCTLSGVGVGGTSLNFTASQDTGTTCSTVVLADTAFILMATAQLSPGRTRIGASQYRILDILAPAATLTAVDIKAIYEARFGPLTTGQRIGLKGYIINTLNGQASATLVADVLLT